MAQIVHDLAPGASLDFATAFNGELGFAENIRALRAAGAKVIVDDVAYFEEPFFQDGPVAAAVNKVTAEGVTYFSAAGNNNLFDGKATKSPRGKRRNSATPAAVPRRGSVSEPTEHCMDFNPEPAQHLRDHGRAGATLTVDLQWAEPWNGVETDLDAFLLNRKGNRSSSRQPGREHHRQRAGTQKRSRSSSGRTNAASQEVQLAINRCSSTWKTAERRHGSSSRCSRTARE